MSKMIETFKMLKEKHSDALILFRVGDFYEAYCEDAQKASEVLGVTLTKYKKEYIFISSFFYILSGICIPSSSAPVFNT